MVVSRTCQCASAAAACATAVDDREQVAPRAEFIGCIGGVVAGTSQAFPKKGAQRGNDGRQTAFAAPGAWLRIAWPVLRSPTRSVHP